jgi:hypothetical protein
MQQCQVCGLGSLLMLTMEQQHSLNGPAEAVLATMHLSNGRLSTSTTFYLSKLQQQQQQQQQQQ